MEKKRNPLCVCVCVCVGGGGGVGRHMPVKVAQDVSCPSPPYGKLDFHSKILSINRAVTE